MGEEADLCVYLTTGDVTGLETELVGQTGYIALQDREDYMSTTVELNSVIIVCLLLFWILLVIGGGTYEPEANNGQAVFAAALPAALLLCGLLAVFL